MIGFIAKLIFAVVALYFIIILPGAKIYATMFPKDTDLKAFNNLVDEINGLQDGQEMVTFFPPDEGGVLILATDPANRKDVSIIMRPVGGRNSHPYTLLNSVDIILIDLGMHSYSLTTMPADCEEEGLCVCLCRSQFEIGSDRDLQITERDGLPTIWFYSCRAKTYCKNIVGLSLSLNIDPYKIVQNIDIKTDYTPSSNNGIFIKNTEELTGALPETSLKTIHFKRTGDLIDVCMGEDCFKNKVDTNEANPTDNECPEGTNPVSTPNGIICEQASTP